MIANITHAGGQVLVWNRPPWDFQLGAIKMSRPAPNSNSKNNLGIVLRVDIHQQKTDEPWPVLLTGDICYKYLPSSLTKDIQALLATHHGANRYVGQPPAASGAAIVAYSYGKGNTYGHPTNIAIQEHFAQGWNTRFDTPNGNIMLSPKSISYSIPCCNKCGL
jgi:beta-lactamase superfamily II metal-dependent hydrolase